ncbi:unnamed protein product [Symbiodinium natans]|uniref:Uncharacterized protein n=1 Tax=Symbiodinium natans TaxID=878477 RepID=A0A812PBN0_9DINO|nr:unnamed protein product [Symbiodinium natans]
MVTLVFDCGCCYEGDAEPPKEVVSADAQYVFEPSLSIAVSSPVQPDMSLSPSSRTQTRLDSLKNLQLEKGMVRAVTLRKSLQQLGRLWRKPLLPMSQEQLMSLHSWSKPATEYDYFLSHTWETPGHVKYLSLLTYSSHRFLMICWVLAVALSWCLCLLELLPFFGHVNPEALRWRAPKPGCPTGPWIICAGFLSVIVGLLLAPHLPDSCSRSDLCFMDAACIHQGDPVKKQQGIDAIAGFLSISQQLRILWSPSYLSRLWCVFEIAAYRKVNPRGQLVLAPLFVERMVLITLLGFYGIGGCIWTIGVMNYSSLAFALALSPCMLLIHALRRSATGKTKLLNELEHFNLSDTRCSLDADREFVLAAIDRWYGSREAFTEYIRGPLRQDLLQSATKISNSYVLLMCTPAISGMLEDQLSLWKAGAPFTGALAHFTGTVVGTYMLWIAFCVRVLISLCVFFAATRRWLVLDYLLTLCIHVTVCGLAFAGDSVGGLAS